MLFQKEAESGETSRNAAKQKEDRFSESSGFSRDACYVSNIDIMKKYLIYSRRNGTSFHVKATFQILRASRLKPGRAR